MGRIVVGAGFLAAPGRAGEAWVGSDAHRGSGAVLGRAFGGRDLALGVGTLLSLREGLTTKHWIRAGILSDAADFAGTFAARNDIPKRGVYATLAIAGGATAVGAFLARELD